MRILLRIDVAIMKLEAKQPSQKQYPIPCPYKKRQTYSIFSYENFTTHKKCYNE